MVSLINKHEKYGVEQRPFYEFVDYVLRPNILVSIAFNGLKFVQQQKEDKALQLQQQQQNLIAERNRQAQEAAEFYNIRGKRAATISKGDK